MTLNDFQIFPAQNNSYVALHWRVGRETVNVRVLSTAIDDEAEATPGEWYGRLVLIVRIGSEDIVRYKRDGGERLSRVAFDPRRQTVWVSSDGKFAD